MKLEPTAALRRLADRFDKPLYIVGGAVRNSVLNLPAGDIDLTGDISPEEVFSALQDSPFHVAFTSKKLFTLSIRCGGEKYEFTSFRTDSYSTGHSPTECRRTSDLAADAARRDFTMNAIYYDIRECRVEDPLNGIEDTLNGIIRTTVSAEKVFSQDGLRLMRLARQAAELGMEIDEATIAAAERNAPLINDIAPERIRVELENIILADERYGKDGAHLRGLRILDGIGVLALILPELTSCKGISQRRDYHLYDVFEHSVRAYGLAPGRVRLAALLHDIGKPLSLRPDGSMTGHEIIGGRLAEEIMSRLTYANSEIRRVRRLIELHMYDLKGEAKENTLRYFIQENHGIIDELCELRRADYAAGGVQTGECFSAGRLEKLYAEMRRARIPFTVKDLKVDGGDLISLGIPEKKRSAALKTLLRAAALGELQQRERQLSFLRKIQKTL